MRNTRYLSLAACLTAAFAACGDDATSTGTDDASPTDTASDAAAETDADDTPLPDAPDDAPDAEPDLDVSEVEDTAPDVDAADTNETDAEGSGDVEADADPDANLDGEETEVEDTTPVSCTDDPSVCESDYVCVDGACRWSLDGSWTEDAFSVVEPEELTTIFDVLKSFAGDAKFFSIDFAGNAGLGIVGGVYGAADILDDSGVPVRISWQLPEELRTVTMYPAEMPSPISTWTSSLFQYELVAAVAISLPGLPTTNASINMIAEEVTLTVTRVDGSNLTAELRGYVTRAEAESRDLVEREQFAALAPLFCELDDYMAAGPMWTLADILDCNLTALDGDLNDDGTLDSYFIRIDATLIAATLE